MATQRVFIARFAALIAVLALLTGCNHKPQPAPLSDVAEPIASPGWINFRADATVKPEEFFARYADALQLAPGTEMRALAAETDEQVSKPARPTTSTASASPRRSASRIAH
jgi:hypothetical protein